MKKSKVYFWPQEEGVGRGVDYFLKKISGETSDKVGFKIHFGEEKNTTYLKPEWVKSIPSIFQEPVFIECNVLYRGSRTTREDHLKIAGRHGFDFLPIDILDGEHGEEKMRVKVDTGRTDYAKLGRGLERYSDLVSLAHFKGHMATGFGGALKNIGMGLGSRSGKLDMHALVSPKVNPGKCVACGECLKHCPADAITIGETASIDSESCIGCVHCIAFCPRGAVEIPWDMSNETNKILMEKIADYALAAAGDRRWWYLNFLTDITYDCDCLPKKQEPFMEDVGLVYGRDPVAVDAASIDLVRERYGGKPFKEEHKVDGRYIIDYAEEIGLGSGEHELREVEV